MKIRTQPLLKATLLGTTILLVYYLVAGIISYQFTQNMLDSGLFDPETFENPETFDPESDDPFLFLFGVSQTQFAVFGVLGGLGSCILWLGAGLGSGAAYTIFHNREEALIETPVKGGAVTGALSFVLGTLAGSLINMLFFFPFMQEMFGMINTVSQQSGGPPPGFLPQMMLVWGISFVFGLICTTLFWGGIGAALGALGSGLGKAVIRNP